MEHRRVYRLRKRYRGFFFGLGLFLAVAATALFVWAMTLPAGDQVRQWIPAAAAGLFLIGAATLMTTQRFHYVLTHEAFERHGLFGVKRLLRDDIVGRRSILMQYGPPTTRLESRSPRSRHIDIHAQLDMDGHLRDWLESLPDYDRQERQQSLDDYLQRDDGRSTAEKTGRLQAAQRTAKVMTGLAVGVCLWAFFYPEPYALALGLATCLPLVALVIAAVGGDAYTLNPGRNEVRANLLGPLVYPGAALMMRAVFDVNLLHWRDGLWATLLLTTAFMALLWIFVRLERERRTSLLAVAFLMLAWGYGASAVGTKLLDTAEPEILPVQVLDKRVSSGKTTTYYLNLAAWGPRVEAEDVDAGRDLYDRVRKGDTVCVYLYPGVMRLSRFEVWTCPA